jgi:hypothetical protein
MEIGYVANTAQFQERSFTLNTGDLFKPTPEQPCGKIALQKPISAIQVFQNEDGTSRLGLLSKLGPGTALERCGDGFNERTVKVRVDGYCYFVFLQELDGELGDGRAMAQHA